MRFKVKTDPLLAALLSDEEESRTKTLVEGGSLATLPRWPFFTHRYGHSLGNVSAGLHWEGGIKAGFERRNREESPIIEPGGRKNVTELEG